MLAVSPSVAQTSSQAPQVPPSAAPQEVAPNVPELSTHEELQTFQVKVNLVEVRVVVRDAHGKAVGNLKQEDFLLFDDNKRQTITKFSVERSGAESAAAVPAQNSENPAVKQSGEVRIEPLHGQHIAWLFDDVNASANDLAQARIAAEQRIGTLQPGDSVAIFTISGQGNQDYTNDPESLRAALRLLKPRPVGTVGPSDCPPIDYYIANQIEIIRDSRALVMVMQEIVACQFDGNVGVSNSVIDSLAHAAANRVLQAGDAQVQLLLSSLGDVVRRVSALPGQRTIVFLSPGFVVAAHQAALTDYLNRAIRDGVMISTLNIRGLYTQPASGVDISQKAWGSAVVGGDMSSYQAAGDLAQADPMMQIANATGGSYFRDRNDLATGLEKLSAPPEYSYLLGFAPPNLKNDGKFHTLKVELTQGAGLTVQARKGYNAPTQGDSNQEAQREIADEVFAQNEMHELPLQLQTQFFQSATADAHIAVLVHIDVRRMAFRKSGGRNLNELTVVAALFDRNANFISAKSTTVQMHIKDDTLATKLNSGITVKSNFDVKPGSYVIRVVARDGQGKLAAQNDVIEIP
jgi:VWFA-related protein